jgi:hypothetical protein
MIRQRATTEEEATREQVLAAVKRMIGNDGDIMA